MTLPSFIDVVTFTVGKNVTSSYRGGVTTLRPAHAIKYVSSDAVDPDAGDEVIGQASIGVQRDTKESMLGDIYVGTNAYINVAGGDVVFAFNAGATGDTQINPAEQGVEVNVPKVPQFSTSIFWV